VDQLTEHIMQLAEMLFGGLEASGYLGVFLLMTIESSFIPFPSEVVMIPAGYWAGAGTSGWQLGPTVLAGLAGSLVGAWINYTLAIWLGRAVLLRYGRHFFIPESKMVKAELYFERHGAITTLVARLIPGIRQLISIPAGLSRMDAFRFSLYTGLGAGAWVTLLTVVGYAAGRQHQRWEHVWSQYGHTITLAGIAAAALLVAGYVLWYRRRTALNHAAAPPSAHDPQPVASDD
jgi:membrane protein DedA with SNARE-associated domain